MSVFHYCYLFLWGIACVIALVFLVRQRKVLELFKVSYWRYILQIWKVVTFVIATIGLVVLAPYTGDPTWDYIDATFMSVLTYVTAPWVVGVLYRNYKKMHSWGQVYIAFCLWMFSASWSYDLYLLIRDGFYPNTWFSNIFASSVLYLSAGLLWNLKWVKGRGVVFGFMESDWFGEAGNNSFYKVLWFALPFMIMASVAILSFL